MSSSEWDSATGAITVNTPRWSTSSCETRWNRSPGASQRRATAWAALAHLCCHETMFGFNPRPDSLRRARQAATRAMDLDAGNQHAWEALAVSCFFDHDRAGFPRRRRARDSVESAQRQYGGVDRHAAGPHGRARSRHRDCRSCNRAEPISPLAGYFAHFVAHYDRGNFTEALHAARKVRPARSSLVPVCAGAVLRGAGACRRGTTRT